MSVRARLPGREPTTIVALAAALSIVAGVVAPGQVVARRRASVEIISTQAVLTPSERSIEICADEKYTLEVTAEEVVVYRWTNDGPGVTHTSHRPLGRAVRVDASASTSAVSISPATATIRQPGNAAAFDIKGEEPGATSLSFAVHGSNLLVVVAVKVVECAYKISSSAHWYFGVGFKPDMFANLSGLLLKRVRANVYIGTGNMHNSGFGTPVQSCTPRITVPDTQVIGKAEIVPGTFRPEVKLNLSYSPVPAGMTVTCPPVPGEGKSSDTAHIETIDTKMKAWEFMDTKTVPQIGESKLGSATSDTFLILELVRP
jgi:hypothetical protein